MNFQTISKQKKKLSQLLFFVLITLASKSIWSISKVRTRKTTLTFKCGNELVQSCYFQMFFFSVKYFISALWLVEGKPQII